MANCTSTIYINIVCKNTNLVLMATQNDSSPQLGAGPKNQMNRPPSISAAILATLLIITWHTSISVDAQICRSNFKMLSSINKTIIHRPQTYSFVFCHGRLYIGELPLQW